MQTIAELINEIARAEAAILAQLQLNYPLGSTVTFRIRHGDGSKPSSGEVVGHVGGPQGRIKVEMASGFRTSIAFEDLVGPATVAA